jgi:hypothetical protein
VIYDWLAECIGNHADCSDIGPYLPTRVIDVGSADRFSSFSVRLVHSQELQGRTAAYTALSHCWGSVRNPVKTTRENLTLHLRGLDFNLLPKTYRDAITITRKLKIQYLWIDSLCIIQDDTADWEHEAANMALVYSHAYLTIAAASTTDSTGGCYIHDTIQPTNLQIKIDHPKGMQTNAYIRSPAYRPNTFYESPLHQRGWILQEVILSRRTLYCTQDQMFWQCNSRQYAEDGLEVGGGGFKIYVDNMQGKKTGCLEYPSWSHWGSFISRDPGNLAIYDLSTPMAAFNTWWRWVADYRSRQLTQVNDRFAALAGIVKHYQTRTNDKPLAGLWERDLKHHLLWAFQEPSWKAVKHQSLVDSGISCRAPSWSWAAIDGRPVHPPQLSPQEQDSNSTTKPGVHFLRSEILWSGEPLTSSLMKAELHLRGLIREMTLHQLRNVSTRSPGERVIPCMPESHNSLICSPEGQPSDRLRPADSLNSPCPLDYRSEAHFDHHDPRRKTVLCLLVAKSGTEEKMLMIEPTGNAANEYRRLGIATHTHVRGGYRYCDRHGCTSDVCERKSSCTGPQRWFLHDDCFQGLDDMTISLV